MDYTRERGKTMMHVEENIELLNKAEAIEETIQPYFKQIERTAFINQKSACGI